MQQCVCVFYLRACRFFPHHHHLLSLCIWLPLLLLFLVNCITVKLQITKTPLHNNRNDLCSQNNMLFSYIHMLVRARVFVWVCICVCLLLLFSVEVSFASQILIGNYWRIVFLCPFLLLFLFLFCFFSFFLPVRHRIFYAHIAYSRSLCFRNILSSDLRTKMSQCIWNTKNYPLPAQCTQNTLCIVCE